MVIQISGKQDLSLVGVQKSHSHSSSPLFGNLIHTLVMVGFYMSGAMQWTGTNSNVRLAHQVYTTTIPLYPCEHLFMYSLSKDIDSSVPVLVSQHWPFSDYVEIARIKPQQCKVEQ